MVKYLVLFFLLVSIPLAYTQESKDYLNDEETYLHAISLYNNKLYPAAYMAFSDVLNAAEKHVEILPAESHMNAQLYQALSATFSGKQNGIPLIKDFVQRYPNHPNTSVAHLELGKYYFTNQQFNMALQELNLVNTSVLTEEQLIDYNMSLGYTYFIHKEFSTAAGHLQSVANSSSAYKEQAIYYLGLSQYFQKNYDAALRNLKLVETNPYYQNEIPYYYSRILFEQKKYDEVLVYLEPKLNSGIAQNPEINQIIGQSYFNLEEYEKALPFLENYSAKADKQSPEAIYQLAYTQYKLGQYEKAVSNFEQLNIVNNQLGQYALYALGESYVKLNQKEKALQAFQRASQLNFNSTIQENAQFTVAKLSYQLGRNNEAIQNVKHFIDTYPNSNKRSEADEMLVDLFLTSTNYKDALAILEKMANRTVNMNEAYQKVSYLRAVELYNNGHLADAKPLFDNVIRTNINARYVALANYWLGEMAYEYNRYPQSIIYIKTFLQSPVNKPLAYTSQANYTLGYNYFKQQDYENAADFFEQVANNSSFKQDANLRLGDSYFMVKNYNQAINAYKSIQHASEAETDYATYQLAILAGLKGNIRAKTKQLKQLYTTNKNSAYADDALYEHGRVYLTRENYAEANTLFLKLVTDYPQSAKVKEAYNQLGLLHFNQANYAEALANYDKVVKNYPNTDEAASALQAIQEIYIQQGKPDAYFAYLRNVKGVDISNTEEERITYLAAETQFKNANCEKAIPAFTHYLEQYNNGFYAANAHFYRGECLNQRGEQDQAIADFIRVTELASNRFTERSLIRVARYHYRSGNYNQAIEVYKRMESSNQSAENIYTDELTIGLMQSYNRINDRNSAYEYAQTILQQPNIDEHLLAEAKFILAVYTYQQDNTEKAMQLLTESAQTLRNIFGAEARFLIAQILFEQNKFQQSITAAYRVTDETPSEDDWVAQSFILIGRNYKHLGELFQAKATLNSVLEHYSGSNEVIIREAEELLREVESLEQQNSTITIQDTPSNQLQLKNNSND